MNIASKDTQSADAGDTAFEAITQMAWNFDYSGKVSKVEDLYRRAKENQWNADDLAWETPIDPSNPIVTSANSDYARMPFFGKLSQQQRETFTAHSTAQMLSQFLHGEQGAMMTAATLTHSMPDTMGKFYAATQTMDEARHVEVYARYIDKLAITYPMVAWLKNLVDVTLTSNDSHKVMIGMNMVIEGLALGAFNNMYRQTNEPLLKSLTFNVMRDESRHVSFGHVYLAPTIAAMHKDDREDLADFAFTAVKILVEGQNGAMEPGFVSVLEQSGIDPKDFAAGVKEAAELGIQNELPPGQVHSLKDLMMPALLRAGLVTARTKELYEKLGVPVNADLSVLEAMEDRGSSSNVLNAEAADY